MIVLVHFVITTGVVMMIAALNFGWSVICTVVAAAVVADDAVGHELEEWIFLSFDVLEFYLWFHVSGLHQESGLGDLGK